MVPPSLLWVSLRPSRVPRSDDLINFQGHGSSRTVIQEYFLGIRPNRRGLLETNPAEVNGWRLVQPVFLPDCL